MNTIDIAATAINSEAFKKAQQKMNEKVFGNFAPTPKTEKQLEEEKKQNKILVNWGIFFFIIVLLIGLFWSSKYIIRHIADINHELKRLKNNS